VNNPAPHPPPPPPLKDDDLPPYIIYPNGTIEIPKTSGGMTIVSNADFKCSTCPCYPLSCDPGAAECNAMGVGTIHTVYPHLVKVVRSGTSVPFVLTVLVMALLFGAGWVYLFYSIRDPPEGDSDDDDAPGSGAGVRQKTVQEARTATKRCAKCGSAVEPGSIMKFCAFCGESRSVGDCCARGSHRRELAQHAGTGVGWWM
jgi:hypothetical protein